MHNCHPEPMPNTIAVLASKTGPLAISSYVVSSTGLISSPSVGAPALCRQFNRPRQDPNNDPGCDNEILGARECLLLWLTAQHTRVVFTRTEIRLCTRHQHADAIGDLGHSWLAAVSLLRPPIAYDASETAASDAPTRRSCGTHASASARKQASVKVARAMQSFGLRSLQRPSGYAVQAH